MADTMFSVSGRAAARTRSPLFLLLNSKYSVVWLCATFYLSIRQMDVWVVSAFLAAVCNAAVSTAVQASG